MPTTRKQKKTRKSRGLEILSDIENLDIMLGGDHSNETERERSVDNILREGEAVLQAITWRMKVKVHVQITELIILGLVPNTVETQPMRVPKLNLTNCRVS